MLSNERSNSVGDDIRYIRITRSQNRPLTGGGLTLLVSGPPIAGFGSSAQAELSDTYKRLSLFDEIFEQVQATYVEKPDDKKLVQSAINGMLAGLPIIQQYAARIGQRPKSSNGIQRISQVVPEYRDELIAQFSNGASI
jgi:hypothetical protein